jgi:cytochrome c biogenesis protein CcmG, thiol:disulfide interchange protein DsbE
MRRRPWQGELRMAAATAVIAAAACAPPPRVEPGAVAPPYAGRTLTGEKVELRALRGDVVLVNVWATWCHPCRREMPALEELHRELADRGLRMIAVSIDDRGSVTAVEEFIREHDLTLTVLHDPGADVARRFATRGVPETFLIGADGVIEHHWIGRIDPRSEMVRGPVRAALRRAVASADRGSG